MKIAIVNDMLLAVEILRRVLARVPTYELCWVAKDGVEAVEKTKQDKPDLILMDLVMPEMNGVEATEQIMAEQPCSILIVTATVEGNSDLVYEALGRGALDVARTPTVAKGETLQGEDVLLAKIQRISNLIGKRSQVRYRPQTERKAEVQGDYPPLVVIGASTGGPQALLEILSELPADFPAAILIVQHVDETFAMGLINWLQQKLALQVELARSGEVPKAGVVYIAGYDQHLQVNADGVLVNTPEPSNLLNRPSINVFFESVAKNVESPGVALLLTGMGRDGADGLLVLKEHGWHTIAQDEASSVVFSMPKAAIDINAVKEVLPLNRIGSSLKQKHLG